MPHCVLSQTFHLVNGFGGISVPDKFCIQIPRMVRRLQREAEIVHREDIFQEFGFLEVTNSSSLAGRIELVGECVRARIEIMVIFGFVNAHAPKNNGRMVPVATNHAPYIVDGDLLPRFVANVLPAWNLFQNEKAEFIAGIKEMTGLRIMRGPDNIALEFVAQDLGITALRPCRHSLSNKWKRLMPVEAAQLDDLAVQFEPVIGELGFPETETARIFVNYLGAHMQAAHAPYKGSDFPCPTT